MRFLHSLFLVYLFFDRRERSAASGFIFFDDKILLVRHTYGNLDWTTPGGFIEKNETPEDGFRREIYEEAGLELENIKLLNSSQDSRPNTNITIHRFYACAKTKQCIIDKIEIKEAGWFSIEEVKGMKAGEEPFLAEAIKHHDNVEN